MNRPEQSLQVAVCGFIDRAYPGLLYFHPANSSGNRGARLGGILKDMGLRAGVPDLCFVLPTGLAGFIELKAGRGKLTPAQEAFRDDALRFGAFWTEARSVPEVADALERWLQPLGWVARARVAA